MKIGWRTWNFMLMVVFQLRNLLRLTLHKTMPENLNGSSPTSFWKPGNNASWNGAPKKGMWKTGCPCSEVTSIQLLPGILSNRLTIHNPPKIKRNIFLNWHEWLQTKIYTTSNISVALLPISVSFSCCVKFFPPCGLFGTREQSFKT